MLSRREMLRATTLTTLVLTAGNGNAFAQDRPSGRQALAGRLNALEQESRGRLGVAVGATGAGTAFAHRGDERFPMASTFKFLLAAAVLAEVDRGRERLDRAVPVQRSDLINYSPTVERFVGRTLTVVELCEATMTLSDNAAANLLLPAIGGPAGLTRFCRSIGDEVTRLDRTEPTLNEALPGDPRDTTSPNAMRADLEKLVLGDVLSARSRERVTGWLVGNRTGDARLRAGVPAGWRVGDKTGTASRGTANDIGILWPPQAPPIIVTSYLTGSDLDDRGQHALHAEVARAVVAAFGP